MIFMTRYYHSFYFPFRFISGIKKLLFIFRLPLAAILVFVVTSCEDDLTQIGAGLLPDRDFISVKSFDTLRVWSYTLYNNSIETDNSAFGFIGQTYDPYFGSATSDFVTQLRLGSVWYNGSFTVDSVKLFLTFMNVVGTPGLSPELRLTEIGEQIYPDSSYYSNKAVAPADPGYDLTVALPVLKTDSINNLVINLPVEFGEYIIRDTSMLFHSDTKPDFRSYFKGLHFSMSSGTDPLLASLYLESPATNSTTHNTNHNYIAIYMHEADGFITQYNLFIDSYNKNASYIRYSHDFSTAEPDKRIRYLNDTVNGLEDTLSYQQYLNGAYTRLIIPGLENMKNNPSTANIAVNKARLSLPVYFDGELFKPSTVPQSLIMMYRDNEGLRYVVPDYSIDTYHTFFDGTLDSTANVYSFNLATFVQKYLDDTTGEIKPELEIYQGSGAASNLILKANSSSTPAKFEVTYTEF
jgi:hypothetical protein